MPEPVKTDDDERKRSRLNIIPQKGERALSVGTTGSGKTTFNIWLLKHIEDSPIFIYDTKHEPKFDNLPRSIVVPNFKNIDEILEEAEHDYVIVRPPDSLLADWETLDGYLFYHYRNLQGYPAYIDEATTFHSSTGRAGVGLINLLSRGRSKGITLLISSQRPKKIDLLCITEAQKLYALKMNYKDDRKRIDELVEDFSKLPIAKPHYFYFMDLVEMEKPVLMSPVKLDEIKHSGYTDNVENPAEPAQTKRGIWI